MNRTPTIVIAGNHNGVGKTSLSVAIIAALRRRGLVIQPFKVGPEVGDALQLGIAAERDCVLIDGWVLDHEKIVSSFSRHTQGCDLAVVEGTHDLFDGIDGNSEQGSTSQIAKVLGAPVVLVFNFWTLTASAAVKGFLQYDEQLQLSGVILNSVVESQQLQQLRANFYRSGVGLDLVGNVPKMSTPVLPPAFECGAFCVPGSEVPEYIEVLADLAEQHMDLDRIVSIAATSRFISRGVVPRPVSRSRVRLAVSRDAAFCLPPAENLRMLQECGADLVFFSPLAGRLPNDVAGIYLTHGFPERFAGELSQNWACLAAIQAFAHSGGPVYAENGGLMYLSQSLQPESAPPFRMAGVFPFRTRITSRLRFGYVEIEVTDHCPLFPRGARARGHYLHYSETVQERVLEGLGPSVSDQGSGAWVPGYRAAVKLGVNKETKIVDEGYSWQKVFGSYVQLNFASNAALAACLVERCREMDVAALTRTAVDAVSVAAASTLIPSTPGDLQLMKRTVPTEPMTAFAGDNSLLYSAGTSASGTPPGPSHSQMLMMHGGTLIQRGEGEAASPFPQQVFTPPRNQQRGDEALSSPPPYQPPPPQLEPQSSADRMNAAALLHLQRSLGIGAASVRHEQEPEPPRTPGGTPQPDGRYSSDIRRVLFRPDGDSMLLHRTISDPEVTTDMLTTLEASDLYAPTAPVVDESESAALEPQPSLTPTAEPRGSQETHRSSIDQSALASFGSISFVPGRPSPPLPADAGTPKRTAVAFAPQVMQHQDAMLLSSPIRGVTISPGPGVSPSPLSNPSRDPHLPASSLITLNASLPTATAQDIHTESTRYNGVVPSPSPSPYEPPLALPAHHQHAASSTSQHSIFTPPPEFEGLDPSTSSATASQTDTSLSFAPLQPAPGAALHDNATTASLLGMSPERSPSLAQRNISRPQSRHGRTKSNPFHADGSLALGSHLPSTHNHHHSLGNGGSFTLPVPVPQPPATSASVPHFQPSSLGSNKSTGSLSGIHRNSSGHANLGGAAGPSAAPGATGGANRMSRSRLNLHHLSHDEMIVAVGPTAAEVISALGLGERLVGISEDCSFPPDIRKGREVISRQPGSLIPPPLAIPPAGSGGLPPPSQGPPGTPYGVRSRLSRPYSTDVFTMSRDASTTDLHRPDDLSGPGPSNVNNNINHAPGHRRQPSGSSSHTQHRGPLLSFDRILSRLSMTFGGGGKPRRSHQDPGHVNTSSLASLDESGALSSSIRSNRTSTDGTGSSLLRSSYGSSVLTSSSSAHLWGREIDSESHLSVLDLEWFKRELPGLVVVERPEHAQQLKELHIGLNVLELHVHTLHATLDAILAVGRAAHASHVALPLVEQIRTRLRKTAAKSVRSGSAPPATGTAGPSQSQPQQQQQQQPPPGPRTSTSGRGAAALYKAQLQHAQQRPEAATAADSAVPRSVSLGPPKKVVVVKQFSANDATHTHGELMVGGGHLPELVALAGGRMCLVHPGDPDQLVSWDALRRSAPDVVIFSAASLPSIEHVLLEVSQLAARAGWWSLPAVYHGEIYIVSSHGAEMLNRPGPRVADAAELLARLLRPQLQSGPTSGNGVVRSSGLPPQGPNARGSKGHALPAPYREGGGKNVFVLKLDLKGGGRCRPKALANYFVRVV